MKKHILLNTAAGLLLFVAACNSKPTAKHSDADSTGVAATATHSSNSQPSDKGSMTASVKELLGDYLQMKNALANDNGKDAGIAGEQMVAAFAKVNSSALTGEQKKEYMDIAADAKEHAEHIGKNASNIVHQREHFDMLSKDMYDLVKTFGAGQVLYQDHCPMYNDGKGATWLSENKEISNPYLGSKMPTCGTVQEELK